MRGRVWAAMALIAVVGAVACMVKGAGRDQGQHESDRAEILRDYAGIKEAHFKHDAAGFLAQFDEKWYRVSDGDVVERSKETTRPDLQSYLDGMKFDEVKDVAPPRVEFSADASVAWLIGQVEVRGQQKQEGKWVRVGFRSAWIDVWEKKAEGWRIVAQSNTEKMLEGKME